MRLLLDIREVYEITCEFEVWEDCGRKFGLTVNYGPAASELFVLGTCN